MATLNSSGMERSRVRSSGNRPRTHPKHSNPQPARTGIALPSEMHTALAHLSDALSIIATAADALQACEDREGSAEPAEIGEHIDCLQQGVAALRRAYDEMDLGISSVSP